MVSFGAERLGSGATVGGFRLVDSIGDGPLGAVWTAVDPERDRGAAVKVIHRPIAHDPAFRRLVEGGGPAVRRDRHRGILATWETGDVERGVYIAMPLCDPHLGAAGPVGLDEALARLREAAAALDWAHEHGFVHGDLRPENVLLAGDGDRRHALVADFGLLQAYAQHTLRQAGRPLGLRAPFAAPEQLAGEPAGVPADVYGLAATLRAVTAPADRPPALEDVIAAALASAPGARPASCGALLDECRDARGRPAPAQRTERAPARAAAEGPPRPTGLPPARAAAAEEPAPAAAAAGRPRPTGLPSAPAAAAAEPPGAAPVAAAGPRPEQRRRRRVGPWLPALALLAAIVVPLGLLTLSGGGRGGGGGGGGGKESARSPRAWLANWQRLPGAPVDVQPGFGDLWFAMEDGTVTRMNSGSRRLTARGVSAVPEPVKLAVTSDALWVGGANGEIARIDPVGNRRSAGPVHLGVTPYDIAVHGSTIWVIDGTAGTVTRATVHDGRVAERRTITVGRGPSGIVAGRDAAWVVNQDSGTLVRLDARTGDLERIVRLGRGLDDVAFAAGSVWVSNPERGTLVRFDPARNAIVKTIRTQRSTLADVVVADDAVWYADLDAGQALRVDPRTNRVTRTTAPGHPASSLSIADGTLWLADRAGRHVHHLDLRETQR